MEAAMATSNANLSGEDLAQAAAESVKSGEHIRERVRDLTLRAFQTRRFDYEGMKEVLDAMTTGISLGAGQRAGKLRGVVADALSGLDQALMKSAEASQLALQELAAKHREFSDSELKQAIDQMKRLESDFIGAAGKAEFRDFVTHAQRFGTDTGTVVAQTMREFSERIALQMTDAQIAGLEA